MLRIAGERIADLFALAEKEAGRSHPELASRYVALARKIGMRYNVRLLPEYRELYCRKCSVFWVEGRTVRTRLRGGRRVRTCLACGRPRRMPLRPNRARAEEGLPVGPDPVTRHDAAVAEVDIEDVDEPGADEEGEEG
jgi:ribonuclease P protein subunit RPR2